MHLNVGDEKSIENPSKEAVIAEVEGLREGEFLILSRSDEVYMQTRFNEDGSWALEYRAGDEDHHYGLDEDETSRADVCKAMGLYIDEGDWEGAFDWEVMDLSVWDDDEEE